MKIKNFIIMKEKHLILFFLMLLIEAAIIDKNSDFNISIAFLMMMKNICRCSIFPSVSLGNYIDIDQM